MTSIYLITFLLGLAFGSFASVIIHRLHTQDQGIFKGRSKCPKCATTLQARDLIPLVSFFINKFKCRFCKKPILFRYPLLEIVMGSGFLMTAILIGLESLPWLLFYLSITFIFVVLSFYDLLFREIPDSITLPAIFITVIVTLLTNTHDVQSLLLGLAIPTLFFGLLFSLSKGRWLGGGDVRIGAFIGALLGWPNVLIGLFLGYLFGALYSLLGILLSKFNRKSQIPFAPFLLLGAYITLFWGNNILNWYLQLS